VEPELGAAADTRRAPYQPTVLRWKRPKIRFPVEQCPLTPLVTVLLNVLEDVVYRRGPKSLGFVEVLPAVGTMFPVVTQPAVADELPLRKARKHQRRIVLWWPEPDLGDTIVPPVSDLIPEPGTRFKFAADTETFRFSQPAQSFMFAQRSVTFRRPRKLF
jgi:hypothetical protein